MGDIMVFGALVGAAIVLRRQSDSHKRLMLLATISLLTAAVGRFLRQLGMGGVPNLFYGTDAWCSSSTTSRRAAACIRRHCGAARRWSGSSRCCSMCSPRPRRGSCSLTRCVEHDPETSAP